MSDERWWHALAPATRWQRVVTAVVVLFLAASAGYVAASLEDGRPNAASADVRFLRDMVAHHEQAIQLSNLELVNGRDPGVHHFAREILFFQSYEIGLMERQLAHWGHSRDAGPATPAHRMPGMATDDELTALRRASGPDADALFVRLMQDHHRGGTEMASRAARQAKDPFVRDLAARMAANQRTEIAELEAARERAGLAAAPAGWAADRFEGGTESADDHEEH